MKAFHLGEGGGLYERDESFYERRVEQDGGCAL